MENTVIILGTILMIIILLDSFIYGFIPYDFRSKFNLWIRYSPFGGIYIAIKYLLNKK